jgi:hypothetical protein
MTIVRYEHCSGWVDTGRVECGITWGTGWDPSTHSDRGVGCAGEAHACVLDEDHGGGHHCGCGALPTPEEALPA